MTATTGITAGTVRSLIPARMDRLPWSRVVGAGQQLARQELIRRGLKA